MLLGKQNRRVLMKKVVEICCGSYQDALTAYTGGAQRIELNSALHLGGLTPSLASLLLAKEKITIPIVCMLRDRGAGFNYSQSEIKVMLKNADILLENGADGIVFGCLSQDGSINKEDSAKFVMLAKKYHKEAIFHRAFDCVKEIDRAIEELIELGVDRVLTSGLSSKAIDGLAVLKDIQLRYADQIEFVVGSGVNHHNAKEIIETTKITQIHSSCKEWKEDRTTNCNPNVSYDYGVTNSYDVVSLELVRKLVGSVR